MKPSDLENYHQEVTKIYLSCGSPLDPEREKYLQENNYKTKYRLYSVNEKKFLAATKNGYSFSKLQHQDQAQIWSHIFKNTQYMGIGHLAISHFKNFQGKKTHPLFQYWPQLKTWVLKIENWAHADMLASVYSDILSEAPDVVYPELKKWSQQKSPWQNRMAIVSLLYYYNPKRNLLPFDDIIKLVEPHLKKDHYYLQKAIGWNLRELSRAYPKEYWKFLNKHLLNLSSTAFTTAIEKVPKNKKEPLKAKRKEARKMLKTTVVKLCLLVSLVLPFTSMPWAQADTLDWQSAEMNLSCAEQTENPQFFTQNNCRAEGSKCRRDRDCCDNVCWNGRCNGDTSGDGCINVGGSCDRDRDCCSGVCWYSECR